MKQRNGKIYEQDSGVIGPVHYLKVWDNKATSVTLQTGNAASTGYLFFVYRNWSWKIDVDKMSTIRGECSGFLMIIC